MKLVSLNIWGGIVYEPLIKFVETQSENVDLFCFQEVLFGSRPEFTSIHKARINIFEEIAERLPEFVVYKFVANGATHFQSEPLDGFQAGQAIFVRRSIRVTTNGGFRGYHDELPDEVRGGKITGSCQWIEIETPQKDPVTIVNFHGLWQSGTKKADTPERLLQSEIIQNFFRERNGKKILCGDFNLLPNGESMAILEKGMKNLIKEHSIQSTRSSFYPKEDKFADYILISPEVKVGDFKVLTDEVSDHLPLYCEFE